MFVLLTILANLAMVSDFRCEKVNFEGTSAAYPTCLDFEFPPDPRIWVSRTMCQGTSSTSGTTWIPSSAVGLTASFATLFVALAVALFK